MRVYWPTTLEALAGIAEDGRIGTGAVAGHGVTPTLRDYYADADPRDLEEELEFVAMSDAAEESVRLIAATAASARRVVLALEVPDDLVPPAERGAWTGPDRSRLRLREDVPLDVLVSVHVDAAEAEADVRAAVAALPAADAGDEDARTVVEDTEGHDLLWYDASELGPLLAAGA